MKKIINKTTMAIILALSMVLALFSGLLFVNHGEVANADDKQVTVTIEALDKDTKEANTSFSKGTEFIARVTVHPTVQNAKFAALVLNIGPTDSTKQKFDETLCGYLSISTLVTQFTQSPNTFKNPNAYKNSSAIYTSGFEYRGNAMLSYSYVGSNAALEIAATTDLVLELKIKIAETVPDGTNFEIGVMQNAANKYAYDNGGSGLVEVNADKFEVNPLTFTVKEPSPNNNLGSLKAGQGEAESDLAPLDITDPNNVTLTVTDITKPLAIFPTTEHENATVKVKPTSNTSAEPTAMTKGAINQVTIPDDGKLTVIVKAENGDEKEYKLNITIVAAKLTNLVATPDSTTDGATKGLKETFDPATLAYTVAVPSDSTKVSITATISSGNSALNTATLTKTGSFNGPATATSGTAFDVTGVANGDKLTIKVSANNGTTTSEKEYVLTFNVLSVNTDITLDVKGKTTNKTFENNQTKATEAGVDYYYVIAGETNAASNVTITADAAATVTLDSNAYTATKELTAGDHTVKVTAAAGNEKTYKFTLKNYQAIQVKSNVVADFMLEEKNTIGDTVAVNRRTYKEKGITHGKDDLDFDRLVIGQIEEYTSINSFLENFEGANIKNQIKLYNQNGELVYDKGSAAGSFTSADLDNTAKGVGTSWKLEYVLNDVVEETIYLSVLGDLNGDGKISALDNSEYGNVITEVQAYVDKFYANVEYRLAMYINNDERSVIIQGDMIKVTAVEIANIAAHMRATTDDKKMSAKFYKG